MRDKQLELAGQMCLSLLMVFCGVIAFGILLALKFINTNIELSWFWVFFPLWSCVIVSFVLFIILVTINFILRKNNITSFENTLYEKSAKQLHHICKKDLGMTYNDIIYALEEDDDIRKTLNKKLTIEELIEENREYIIDYIINCYEELGS